ncbi:hypothetical protein E2320_014409 [Naja naja]|nr:hypothetical protein E2320_014409 [Naja naja]
MKMEAQNLRRPEASLRRGWAKESPSVAHGLQPQDLRWRRDFHTLQSRKRIACRLCPGKPSGRSSWGMQPLAQDGGQNSASDCPMEGHQCTLGPLHVGAAASSPQKDVFPTCAARFHGRMHLADQERGKTMRRWVKLKKTMSGTTPWEWSHA